MPSYRTTGHYVPDSLISGSFPLITHTITLVAGQSLKRGAVLGRQASGKYTLSEAKAKDGSEQPSVILSNDVDSTEGEKQAVVYLSGQFNANAVSFGEGHSAESAFQPLRNLNIYLTNTI